MGTDQQRQHHRYADGARSDRAPSGPEVGRPADPVLHINREVIHPGAEMGTLRDLYRAGNTQAAA